jgi:hypothetical protein
MRFLTEVDFKRGSTNYYAHGVWLLEYSTSMGHGEDPVPVCHIGVEEPPEEVPTELVAEYMLSSEYLSSTVVIAAIDEIQRLDPDYWKQTLGSRLQDGVGSRTSYTTEVFLERALRTAEWMEYIHPEIAEGCKAYCTTDISGRLGVEKILPQNWYTYQEKGGKVFATLTGRPGSTVNFTVAIVGPEGDLWTFHPGEPVRPSQSTDLSLVGTTEQGYKAIERGFSYAKIADK